MEFTAEEFQQSDEVWLAENIFSQLKEFNVDDHQLKNCDNNLNYNCNNNINYNKNNNNHVNDLIDEKQELVFDLSTDPNLVHRPFKDLNEIVKEEDFTNDMIEESHQFEMENNDDGSCDLNNYDKDDIIIVPVERNDTENNGYYEVVMSMPPNGYSDNIMIVNEMNEILPTVSSIPSTSSSAQIIKCMNCDQIFDESAFVMHVCDYDADKNLIILESDIEKKPTVLEPQPEPKTYEEKLMLDNINEFLKEPPCIRQLRENNARIRKFLKDELKIDLAGPSAKKDGPHECSLCERKFVHASGLARHMEKHAMDLIPATASTVTESKTCLRVLIKCLMCGRIFYESKNALDHIYVKHQKKPSVLLKLAAAKMKQKRSVGGIRRKGDKSEDLFIPPSLGLIQNAISSLDDENKMKLLAETEIANNHPVYSNQHVKIIILSSVLQCEFCDNMFCDVANLLVHSAGHNPKRGFECYACEIFLLTSKEMFLHWQAECPYARELLRNNFNLQKYYVCNVCENKFITLEQLFEHRYAAMHLFPRVNPIQNKMQICCEYCGGVFDTATDVIRHHEEKHFKKTPKKEVPTTTATTAASKYRQYLCDVCGKSYTQSSHLWQHLRFHRGVKPFACKEAGCNRRFTIRPDLNDHIRKCHTGERPYHCLVCGKRFLTGSVFYQHRLIHRGERRYGCEECGKRFYRADALKNHQRIHTGEKPYACMYCSKNFRQRGDRDKHIRARHSNLDENARNILASIKNSGGKNTTPLIQQGCVFPPSNSASMGLIENDGVVYIGNVPFPASMFKPIMEDIDAPTC